ncbi:MAG: formylglycine-generating enzyme family protein [Planctomycetota bacterium]|jgi:formylglycine-generating enzyme required for sulfatase activity
MSSKGGFTMAGLLLRRLASTRLAPFVLAASIVFSPFTASSATAGDNGDGDPAGMVKFPGGTIEFGIDEKPFKTFLKATAWGRMGKGQQESTWKNHFSMSTSAVELEVDAFWMGRFEVTNAQWAHFLDQTSRLTYTVPPLGKPGARTLEDISRLYYLAPPFKIHKKTIHPVALTWKKLYDINAKVLNPANDPPPYAWQKRLLEPGTKLKVSRYSLPESWRTPSRTQLDMYPSGSGDFPVTGISLVDALAFARYYGCHIPDEVQWEAAARGHKGFLFPEGEKFEPLGHAWSGFDQALAEAKKKAEKALPKAEFKLKGARDDKNEFLIKKYQAEVDRLTWIRDAVPLNLSSMEFPAIPVGSFPLGRSPIGCEDMLGLSDEWVANLIYPYEKTVSKSPYLFMATQVLRGGNYLEGDFMMNTLVRKATSEGGAIGPHFRFTSTGFRVARAAVPGLSMAMPSVDRIHRSVPAILPGWYDSKRTAKFVSLDLRKGTGIHRLEEWRGSGEPDERVYYKGRARGLTFVPVSGTPFDSIGKVRKAADKATPPKSDREKSKRGPRDIPFLGLLWMSDGMEIKGDRLNVTVRREDIEDEPAEPGAADEPGGTDEPKDPAVPTEEDPAPPAQGEGGAEAPPAEGEGGKTDDASTEKTEEEKPRKGSRRVKDIKYEPGSIKGGSFPEGLLLGWMKWGTERRPVLWEARQGIVPHGAPGGQILLERPLLVLEQDDLVIEAGTEKPASSSFDDVAGICVLKFFVPSEGKRRGFNCTLTLRLSDFPEGTEDSPWQDHR